MNTNITEFSNEGNDSSDSIPENVEKFARMIVDMIMVEMDARDEKRARQKKEQKEEQKRMKEEQKRMKKTRKKSKEHKKKDKK